jgi:hypothetical protein
LFADPSRLPRLPSTTARGADLKWFVRGCCANGKGIKTGVRNGHDLDTDVKVTNRAACDVRRVGFRH